MLDLTSDAGTLVTQTYPLTYHYHGLTVTITKTPGFKARYSVTAGTAEAQLRDYRRAILEQASHLAKVPANLPPADLLVLRTLAISRDGNTIKYVPADDQIPELAQLALRQDPWSLQYLAKPTEQLSLQAVSKDGLVLQFVTTGNKTYQVILAAVQQDPLALKWSGLTKEDQASNNLTSHQIGTIYLTALRQNGALIGLIKQPDYELAQVALSQNPRAIANLVKPSEEICLLAVQQDGLVIELINQPSEGLALAAVKQNPAAIKYIKNKTAAMVQLALDQDVSLMDWL